MTILCFTKTICIVFLIEVEFNNNKRISLKFPRALDKSEVFCYNKKGGANRREYAGMVKLADTLDLGSNAERRAGSSPVTRTNKPPLQSKGGFVGRNGFRSRLSASAEPHCGGCGSRIAWRWVAFSMFAAHAVIIK